MPITTHEPWVCSRESARNAVVSISKGVRQLMLEDGEFPTLPKVPKMPQDFTFVNRLQWGLASVMAGLGTVARFRPVMEALGPGPARRGPERVSESPPSLVAQVPGG